MRQLLPERVEHLDLYAALRPVDLEVPVLRVNMVASADGAATDRAGRSGGLGQAGDLEVFRTLRALADGILVGAGTVRTEGYGPHRVRPDLAARRALDGRELPAAVVVVSRSLDLDFAAPLFARARTPTVVLTCRSAPAERLRLAEAAGRVVVAGDERVDLRAGITRLRQDFGMTHLLCEGGPLLNTEVLGDGLTDELCLTLAPALIGGSGPRIVARFRGKIGLELVSVMEDAGELYLRYRVRGAAP